MSIIKKIKQVLYPLKKFFWDGEFLIRNHVTLKSGTTNAQNRFSWVEAKLKAIPQGHKILDAGAGELFFKKFCTHLNYVAQDFAKYDGKGDNKGFQQGTWDQTKIDIVSDITEIPAPAESFDAIMCIEVFEHIPKPLDALKEFSRLLKKGGRLIITAPFCSLTHFSPYFYHTGFSRYFYETHLAEYGFKISELTPSGNYFEYISQEIRRIPDMTQNYSSARLRFWEKFILDLALGVTGRISKKDKGSSDILCDLYPI